MSDICLCYAWEDRQKASNLAAFLKEEGKWSVSFAVPSPADDSAPSEINLLATLVEGATVVVVLWSKEGRESAFLREMRRRANRDSTLVALLEKVEPPPEEENSGLVDLSGWDGAADLKAELSHPSAFLWAAGARRLGSIRSTRRAEPARPISEWGEQLRALLLSIRHIMRERAGAPAAAPGAAPKPSAPPASPAINPEKNAARPVQWRRATPVDPQPEAATPQPAAASEAHASHAGGHGFAGVFISYRRNDAAAYARGLYDRLAARFGKERVFLDVENVGWGEDFVEAITAAAESCAVMIALISRGWARGEGGQEGADDHVRLEVAKALGRRIRVIPILIQGATMPPAKELPEDLTPLLRRNALALTDTRWDRDVEDLMKALEGLLKA